MFALNPLNAELNPICHLLALLGAHPILYISKIRVKNGFPPRTIEDYCGHLTAIINITYFPCPPVHIIWWKYFI
jgi:hypothetical protein